MRTSLLPFTVRSRRIAIAFLLLLAAGDVWLVLSRARIDEPAVTFSVRDYFPVPEGNWAHDAFRLEEPAQLNRDGNGWIVEGRQVTSLTNYVETKIVKGNYDSSYVENYRVDLGEEQTFGRAIRALTLLASEGTCNASIVDMGSEVQPDPWEILTIQDRSGKMIPCRLPAKQVFSVSATEAIIRP